jgi:hypothetical protein
VELVADSAAMVQEAAWELVESAWAVMEFLALVILLLLQPFAVNLINANKTSDKIPVFLVRETASARGPG